MIVGICSNKGGSGKSTTAVHLIYWLVCVKNASAILIDTDAQASSSDFIERLNEEYELDIAYEAFTDVDDMTEKVIQYSDEYDFVIIDSPGNSNEITRSVVWISNLVIVPLQHTAFDEKGAISTFKIVKNAQEYNNGKPIALSFISRAIPNSREGEKSLARLKGYDSIKFLNNKISQKVVIGKVSDEDATVWQMKGTSAKSAQSEYHKLFQEVWKYMK